MQQLSIFDSVVTEKPQVVRKLPYKFSYLFTDENDRESTLMIEDWEIGALYWNSLKRYEGHDKEAKACADVRKKYLQDHAKTKDVYLFLGTSQQFHFIGPNPFIIIGTFYPKFPVAKKVEPQLKLF